MVNKTLFRWFLIAFEKVFMFATTISGSNSSFTADLKHGNCNLHAFNLAWLKIIASSLMTVCNEPLKLGIFMACKYWKWNKPCSQVQVYGQLSTAKLLVYKLSVIKWPQETWSHPGRGYNSRAMKYLCLSLVNCEVEPLHLRLVYYLL